jgi:mannose-6-phosphate isomerase
MTPLCPLRFEPIFRRYIWGGRKLGEVLGKPIGPEGVCAESWEIVDHGDDQSVVAAGPLAGRTLGELTRRRGEELLGPDCRESSFPLLLKFLDAAQTLSVQVHPNDEQAARLDPPDRGKTEAWVVIDAEPEGLIYAGLKPGVNRPALAQAIEEGRCEECLHRFHPEPGDCVFLPAGTVHALGEGLLVAEIQQASDTTYRLFDWNRLGTDGKPRELHVEQGLTVIDWDRGPVGPQQPQPTDRPHVSRLVECDKFLLDRWQIDSPQTIGGDGRAHVLAVLAGSVAVEGDVSQNPLSRGDTMLLPASAGAVALDPAGASVLLDAHLPE